MVASWEEPLTASSSPPAPSSQQPLDPIRRCAVCEGQATGYHYEVLSCNGCKSFFRRTYVTNRTYVCRKGRACFLNKALRRKCRSCRYKKCVEVGMNPGTIITTSPLVHTMEEPSSSCTTPETSGASSPLEQQIVSKEWCTTTRNLIGELMVTEAGIEDLRLSVQDPPSILLDILTRPSALPPIPRTPDLNQPSRRVSIDVEMFALLEYSKTFTWFCQLKFSDKLSVMAHRLPAVLAIRLALSGSEFEEGLRTLIIPLKNFLVQLKVDKATVALVCALILSENHDLNLSTSGMEDLERENKSYASCLAAYLFQKNSVTDSRIVEQHFLLYWKALNLAGGMSQILREHQSEDSLCRQVIEHK